MKSKTGRDITRFSVYGSEEQEILFGTNTKWKIGKVFERIWGINHHNERSLYTEIELIEL